MSGPPPLRAPGAADPIRWVAADGLIEGSHPAPEELREVLEALRTRCGQRCDLRVEGARFSALLDDEPRPAEGNEDVSPRATREALEEALTAIVAGVAPEARATLTSTWRLVEIGERDLTETLLALDRGEPAVVSRRRPLGPEDRARLTRRGRGGPFSFLAHMNPVRRAAFAGLVLAAVALFVWRSAIGDRLLAPSLDALASGPVDAEITADVETRWGLHHVTVRRGPAFPEDPAEARRRLAAAVEPERRRALEALAERAPLLLVLEAEDGTRRGTVEFPTRALFRSEPLPVEITLPGSRDGRRLRITR
ncbi:MAG: hypothetical protein R3F20_19430 [Planctomycetota bacterium]